MCVLCLCVCCVCVCCVCVHACVRVYVCVYIHACMCVSKVVYSYIHTVNTPPTTPLNYHGHMICTVGVHMGV